MSIEIRQLEEDVSRAKEHLKVLEERHAKATKQEREERQRPLREITTRAHKLLCRWNHTDGCGWGYEEGMPNEWDLSAHRMWIDRLEELMEWNEFTVQKLGAILDLVQKMKEEHPDGLWILRRLEV